MLKIPGPEAFVSTLRNKSRKYPDRKDTRFSEDYIWPAVQPGFRMAPKQTVFTIGSCFARNVEEELVRKGLNVPTQAFSAPHEEAPGRPNRVLNQYNPATMLQAVRGIETGPDSRGLYPAEPGKCLDALLSTGSRPVTTSRAAERREQIDRLYREGLAAADVVVITLGLVEAWYDAEDDIYLNEAPPHPFIKSSGDRFEFHQLGVSECQRMVFELIERLVESGRRKVVLTVSPVPLQVTFAGGDAVMRNSYSKSVLRVVAELASQAFADVDYFPSYEIITASGLRSFGEDNVHVRPRVVANVVNHMLSLYAPDL